jgi:ribulose-5-phosphate 4-epimerase/fuculose-1-phosphate aldolase
MYGWPQQRPTLVWIAGLHSEFGTLRTRNGMNATFRPTIRAYPAVTMAAFGVSLLYVSEAHIMIAEAFAQTLTELVLANRILAREEVIDDFGHVSVRHPDNPERYFLARSRSPGVVTREDIIEFTLQGEPIPPDARPMYSEIALHSAVFMARPDVNAVVHHHARSVLPFTVVPGLALRPLFHMAAVIGAEVPLWDSHTEFDDTGMLIDDLAKGDSVARALGQHVCVLLRGHGAVCVGASLREAVFRSIYMKENAALVLKTLPLGEPTYLTPSEVDQTARRLLSDVAQVRAWDYRVARAGFAGL